MYKFNTQTIFLVTPLWTSKYKKVKLFVTLYDLNTQSPFMNESDFQDFLKTAPPPSTPDIHIHQNKKVDLAVTPLKLKTE